MSTATPVLLPPAKLEVVEIGLESLERSASNPRRTMNEADLQELAASIREHGVQVPLLVRPLRSVFVQFEDGTEESIQFVSRAECAELLLSPGAVRTEVDDRYEIIAGHRRARAAEMAGLSFLPCIVLELTDEQAAERALIDNLQRVDVPPMEEAEAFGKLLEATGATIETVAATLAKSPSYVGRRLQLLKAIEPVRQALRHGAIEVGHAMELAPLDEALQRQLLSRMQVGVTLVEPSDIEDETGEPGECRFCGCTDDDGCRLEAGQNCSWANEEETVCTNPDCLQQFRAETGQGEAEWKKTHYSVVELRREIAETAFRTLKDAPFPLTANLPPVSCAECPKRAGNAQLLFDDCAQDTCTDRPCFNRKVNAWIDAELDAAKADKRKLLKLTPSWTSDKERVYVSEYHGVVLLKTPSECPHGEEGIWVDGRNAGHRAVVCRKADCKTHRGRPNVGSSSSSSRSGSSQVSAKEQEERKKKLAKLNAEKKYREALFAGVAKAPINTVYATDLNLEVCLYAISRAPGQYEKKVAEALGWPADIFGWGRGKELRERMVKLAPVERLRVALVAAHAGELGVNEYSDSKPEHLEKLAGFLGLDTKKIREECTAKPAKAAAEAPKAAKPDAQKKAAAKKAPAKKAPAKKAAAKKAVLSQAARKRIVAAQKKRWAAAKEGGKR